MNYANIFIKVFPFLLILIFVEAFLIVGWKKQRYPWQESLISFLIAIGHRISQIIPTAGFLIFALLELLKFKYFHYNNILHKRLKRKNNVILVCVISSLKIKNLILLIMFVAKKISKFLRLSSLAFCGSGLLAMSLLMEGSKATAHQVNKINSNVVTENDIHKSGTFS
jgi:hypothetical protein